jgi:hypothetical protein
MKHRGPIQAPALNHFLLFIYTSGWMLSRERTHLLLQLYLYKNFINAETRNPLFFLVSRRLQNLFSSKTHKQRAERCCFSCSSASHCCCFRANGSREEPRENTSTLAVCNYFLRRQILRKLATISWNFSRFSSYH